MISKLKALEPLDLLRVLILGEAEAEPLFGKLAVAQVVKNRMLAVRYPNDWVKVMLDTEQFPCFLPEFFRPETLKTRRSDNNWKESHFAAFGIFYNYVSDVVDGSTRYHLEDETPFWSRGFAPVMHIGKRLFYNL